MSLFQRVTVICIHHSIRESGRPRTADTHLNQRSICLAFSHRSHSLITRQFQFLENVFTFLIWMERMPLWLLRLLSFVNSISFLVWWFTKLNCSGDHRLFNKLDWLKSCRWGFQLQPIVQDTLQRLSWQRPNNSMTLAHIWLSAWCVVCHGY